MFQLAADFATVGRPYADFMRLFAERGDYGPCDIEAAVAERVAHARRGENVATTRKLPDGTVVDIRRSIMPSGHMVTTYNDVTGRQRLEDQLQRQVNELSDIKWRLEEQGAELAASNEELATTRDAAGRPTARSPSSWPT